MLASALVDIHLVQNDVQAVPNFPREIFFGGIVWQILVNVSARAVEQIFREPPGHSRDGSSRDHQAYRHGLRCCLSGAHGVLFPFGCHRSCPSS